LRDAYYQIYQRILGQEGNSLRLALNAFRWIKSSFEPLSSEIRLDAIAAHVDDAGNFFHEGPLSATILLKVCQNLLIFDERLTVFRFAHLSVEEYLEEELSEVDSHRHITKVCLSLLCAPYHIEKYDKSTPPWAWWGARRAKHLLMYTPPSSGYGIFLAVPRP
jgi:hypothetical protein